MIVLVSSGLYSCKDDTTDPPAKNQDNYNAYLKYDFKGVNYETKSFVADYGSKIFITGFDASGSILVDFALRAQKDELLVNQPFSLDASGELSIGILYVGSAQWMIGNGQFSITKHEKNRLSGSFSGKAYQIEYSGQDPVIVDSAFVNNGVFNDIPVKD